MSIKVTIFTRAYNTEKYVSQCIESVLNQTLIDFEYLLFDNGSTDNTSAIIQHYATIDNRIKVIRIDKNSSDISLISGLANCSRIGKGEYFTELDSDDYIEQEYLQVLYNNARKNNAQISVSGQNLINQETGIQFTRGFSNELRLTKKEYGKYFKYYHALFRPVWGKLFSKKLVNENWEKIMQSRPDYLTYGGDTYSCIELLKNTESIYFSCKNLYNYRIHNKSVSYNYNINRFKSDLFLFDNAKTYLFSIDGSSADNLLFIEQVYLNAIYDTINVLLNSNKSFNEKINSLNEILTHKNSKHALSLAGKEDTRSKGMFNYLLTFFKVIVKKSNKNKNICKKICECLYAINPILEDYVNNKNLCYVLSKNNFLSKTLFCDEETFILREILMDDTLIIDNDIGNHIVTVLKKNILLGELSLNFIKKYRCLVATIYNERYVNALDQMLNMFEHTLELPYLHELVTLSINLAAYVEDSGVFWGLSKMQAEIYMNERDLNTATKMLNELLNICPNDNDIIFLMQKCNSLMEIS